MTINEKEKPTVNLVGCDGNAFAILGKAQKALKKEGYTQDEVDEYFDEATSGDYDHLLQVTMKWCDVQ